MADYSIMLPSKPRIVKEDEHFGVYEIDNLYPGYGHTLGNSLRRIILSSLPGAAITSIKIDGVSHEYSTIEGVKEDVITFILNLKKVRLQILSDEPQTLTLKIKGPSEVRAGDIEVPGQVKILNPDCHIASVTQKGKEMTVEMKAEKGLGYVSKELIQRDRVEIGSITLDAVFTPIRRVNYEVENMRVGNRTDFNRIKLSIETDGTITPHQALTQSIEIMINQLKAVVGFKEEVAEDSSVKNQESAVEEEKKPVRDIDPEILKTRIETLDLSARTVNALTTANIRTVGGLVRKKEEDILEVDGLGGKGVQEIKKALASMNLSLRE